MTESITPEPIQEPVSVDDNGGALTVDGTVAVTQSGTWDEVGINDSGNSITVDWAGTAPPIGAGTEAAALRVTVATDSTGVLSVDDNGGALTVDGTVAVTNAGLTALNGAIAGTEVQVDVLTMPTVTVDSELTTADLDTGAGTDTRAVVGLIGSKSGGGQLIPGDATAGLKVDLGADNDVTITSGSVTEASASAIKTAVELIDDTVATDGAATPTKGLLIAGQDGTNAQTIKTDTSGELQIDVLTIAAGDNNIGNVDIVTVPAPLSTTGGGTEATALRVTVASDSTGVLSVDDNGGSLTVDGTVTAAFNSANSGGCEFYKTIDLDETEEEVSATAATLYGMWVTNTATATRFVKFYNATAANVTVGTTAPDITIGIPGNTSDDVAGNLTVPFPGGAAFGTALTIAATTLVADNDATAPGANDVIVTLFYRN